MTAKNIKEVLKKHVDEIMNIPGVAGVGEGESQGKPCIRVFLLGGSPESLKKIPAVIGGYPVIVEHIDEFRALGN
jgi:hypothetical protein